MKTFSDFVRESVDQGLYSYRPLNAQSAEYFQEWMSENNIPNPIASTGLHCTIVCSEDSVPGYSLDPAPIMLNPASFKINTLNGVLVVQFKSDLLEEQWQRAMNMGAKNRFPRFIPHISLSYAIPEHYDSSDLKPPHTVLVLDAEKSRPMVNGWTALDHANEDSPKDEASIYVPQNSLNIPREDMPQIADVDKMAFVDWLEAKGIRVQFLDLPVSILRSVQDEIDLKKVETLAAKPPGTDLEKPLIISKENYIMDGHHRFLATLNRDPHKLVAAYRVDLRIRELLSIARNFPKVFYKQRVSAA